MLKEAHVDKTGFDRMKLRQRHLDFSGAKNFRDLGGYPARDGRTVRWGLLYRSDGLNKLTDTDIKLISSLSLQRVIDFRSDYERELEPDRLPADGNIQRVEIPMLDASTALIQESRDELAEKLKWIDPVQYMTDTYTGFVNRFTPDFGRFLREVASAHGQPVLFHCTAGKDRTGFAAALLLKILDVPHETVAQDYLLTNDYFFAGYRRNLMLARILKGKRFAESLKGFMRAELTYLSVAFDTIDREYGSFETYIHEGVGLSTTDVERFRAIYLE